MTNWAHMVGRLHACEEQLERKNLSSNERTNLTKLAQHARTELAQAGRCECHGQPLHAKGTRMTDNQWTEQLQAEAAQNAADDAILFHPALGLDHIDDRLALEAKIQDDQIARELDFMSKDWPIPPMSEEDRVDAAAGVESLLAALFPERNRRRNDGGVS